MANVIENAVQSLLRTNNQELHHFDVILIHLSQRQFLSAHCRCKSSTLTSESSSISETEPTQNISEKSSVDQTGRGVPQNLFLEIDQSRDCASQLWDLLFLISSGAQLKSSSKCSNSS